MSEENEAGYDPKPPPLILTDVEGTIIKVFADYETDITAGGSEVVTPPDDTPKTGRMLTTSPDYYEY